MNPTTSIKLDPEMKDRLERIAERRRRAPHWLLREAVEQFVDREERRAAFLQDAVNAWEDFEATGLHLTSLEADQWLAALEAGEDIDPPACHR